jgi:plastocyanin
MDRTQLHSTSSDLHPVVPASAPVAHRVETAPRRFRPWIATGVAGLAVLSLAAAAMVAGASEPTHDLTLVARDMAFYLPKGGGPNPRLEVPAQEEVRITLVNRDAGIDHDLAVNGLGVESEPIPGDGSSTTIEFRAPREPGEYEYLCRLHGKMMRGTLAVR